MKDTIAEELKHIVADKHKISEEFKKATAKIEELEASAQYSAQQLQERNNNIFKLNQKLMHAKQDLESS